MLHTSNKGFTLVELSVVLVIIALLTAGIVVGKDLVAAAALRKELTQADQIAAGINVFRMKYNCIPGDCSHETDFFGPNLTTMATCTGNGDGDGYINHWPAIGGLACEVAQAAQVLLLDGLIPEKLAIIASDTGLMKGPNNSFAYLYYTDLYGAVVRKGIALAWAGRIGGTLLGPVFSAPEARLVDQKIDDGLPNSGNFYGLDSADSSVVAGSCQQVGLNDYADASTLGCRTIYFLPARN